MGLVVLLQFPQSGPVDSITDAAAREQEWRTRTALTMAWDDAARQAAAAFPGRALYLTNQQLFAPDGRFMTWMRTPEQAWVRARKLDNTHLCPYGAAQFGALVTQELTPLLGLGPLEARMGVRGLDARSPVQRSARLLSGRPAAAGLPRHPVATDPGRRRVGSVPGDGQAEGAAGGIDRAVQCQSTVTLDDRPR